MTMIRKWLFRVFGLILFLAVLIWASENSESVSIVFLGFRSDEWPVAWWMLMAFVAGVFIGVLLNSWTNTLLKIEARKARKEAEKEHKKVDQLAAQAEALSSDALQAEKGSAQKRLPVD